MKTRTWTTSTLLAIVLIVGQPSLILSGVAQNDEDPIGDSVNITAPGFEANVSGFVANLAPMPSTPMDPLEVYSPFPSLNITVGPVEEGRVCLADETLGDELGFQDDTLPCKMVVRQTLTATCDTVFSALRQIPHIGTPIANSLESTVQAVDESVAQALHDAYGTLPQQIRDNIGEPEWTARMHDALVHCRGELQSIQSLAGTDPSQLIIELGLDIDICPWPEVIPHCEPVSDSADGTLETEGNQEGFSQQPCSFDNLIFSCGTVQLKNETLGVDEEVDPFEQWNQVVDNLSVLLRIDLELDDYDQQTLSLTEFGAESSGGDVGCELGGLPQNSGVIPGSWSLTASASVVEGDFPFWEEVQDTVNPLLVLIFDTTNGVLSEASAAWSDTVNDIVGTINDAWNEEDEHGIGETFGFGALHGDGGTLATSCGHTPPEPSAQEPHVDHEHLDDPPLPP